MTIFFPWRCILTGRHEIMKTGKEEHRTPASTSFSCLHAFMFSCQKVAQNDFAPSNWKLTPLPEQI
jgi:hypothetical protein